MSLADHYDPNGEHSQFIPPGNHPVTIVSHRTFQYKTGSPGVEFEIQDDLGRKLKHSFCCKASALWKLANFAADIGMTEQQMRAVDPESGHNMHTFRGKRYVAVVEKPGQYSEVTGWAKLSGQQQQAPASAPPIELPPEPTEVNKDDLPF